MNITEKYSLSGTSISPSQGILGIIFSKIGPNLVFLRDKEYDRF